jgi:hypothetical protein
MKSKTILLTLITCSSLVGCTKTVRSISQSGYQEYYSYAGPYSRELDEFDVLGLDRDKPVTDEEIRHVSSQSKPIQLAPGSTILLIQSGALYPDGPMITELSKHFRVVPFTGVASEKKSERDVQLSEKSVRNAAVITDPNNPVTIVPLTTLAKETYRTDSPKTDPAAYSRVLRLAAARAGASTVVCYWGILESGNEEIATKSVSWIPVMNWFVYDERQHMRIRLKVAVVDVMSGNWSVFSAQPFEGNNWSVRSRREVKDQKLVEGLKQKAYQAAARELLQQYAEVAAK